MPLPSFNPPQPAQPPLASEAPKIVLAAPGSVTPPGSTLPGSTLPRRLTHALAAGSLLAVGLRPLPRPAQLAPATNFTVTNLNSSGPGSLLQAEIDTNVHPGPDTINFQTGLTGIIPLTTTLVFTDSVAVIGPGPGALSVSGGNAHRVFYLYVPLTNPFTATISGLTIRDGNAADNGGGISALGVYLTLDHVNVVSNTSNNGGGVYLAEGLSGPQLITASLALRDSIISGNHADFSGGGLNLYGAHNGITIQRTQILSNTAAQNGGGVDFYADAGPVTLQNLVVVSNTATANGGGLAFVGASGAITLEDSSLISNTAFYGGGAFLQKVDGTSVIRRTTISGNQALAGGGVYFYSTDDPTQIENSTISGNHASQFAGGLSLYDGSYATLLNSTVVSNTASQGGGIVVLNNIAPVANSIIAGNIAPHGPDITGTFQLKYDLVQITGTATISDGGGNLFGLDPLLGPLADNGGPTRTHLPRPNSPAINMGDPAFAPPPSTDQRGDPRVVGGRLDMGAVEAETAEHKLFLPVARR